MSAIAAGWYAMTTYRSEEYCPHFQAILTASIANGDTLVTRTRCKMWSCEFCAARNREIWRAWLIDNVNKKAGAWSWFTITAHSKKRGERASLTNLRGAWDKLIKRMKRHLGKFEYVRVYEKHKDGSYHAHALISAHFGDIRVRCSNDGSETKYSVWLANAAKECGLGYYTHADDIPLTQHAGYIVSYISKYIVKIDASFKRELGRVRHIQASQGFGAIESLPELDWSMRSGIYLDDVIAHENAGTLIKDINTGEIVTEYNFVTTYIYPQEFDHRA